MPSLRRDQRRQRDYSVLPVKDLVRELLARDAAIEAALALHYEREAPKYRLGSKGLTVQPAPECGVCSEPWPCPTVSALTRHPRS